MCFFIYLFYLVSDEESIWKVPISIDYPDKYETYTTDHPTTPSMWLETKTDTFQAVFKPYYLNVKATGYYRVNYDEENWRALIKALHPYGRMIRINRLNRAQMIDDIMNLARCQKVDYDLALDFMLYLKEENDYIPWEAAFR